MGSIISKLADEIKLHGSYQAYCAWRDMKDPEVNFILSNGIPISRPFLPPPPKFNKENGIPYFPDPEVVEPGGHYLDALYSNEADYRKFQPSHLHRSGKVKKVYYLRVNNEHDDQKGSCNDSLGNT